MDITIQYLIFPIFVRYVLSSIAEAIQNSTNDNNDVTSSRVPKVLPSSDRGRLYKNTWIGYCLMDSE